MKRKINKTRIIKPNEILKVNISKNTNGKIAYNFAENNIEYENPLDDKEKIELKIVENSNKDCVIILTNFINDRIIKKYESIDSCKDVDAYIVLDNHFQPDNTYPSKFRIVKIDGYKLFSTMTYYNCNHNIYEGNPQNIVWWFFKTIDNSYKNYWFVEDDLELFDYSYQQFFDEVKDNKSDLLVVEKKETLFKPDKSWSWYKYCNKYKYNLHTLLTFFRISRKGAKCLLENYRKDDKAHTECFIPSTINNKGLSIDSFSDITDYNFYNDFKVNNNLYDKIGEKKTFCHPIKFQKPKENKDWCIITLIKNEHKYLKEFIEYYNKLGVSTIYIFEDYNSCTHINITKNYNNVQLKSIVDILGFNYDVLESVNRQIKLVKFLSKNIQYFKEKYAFIIDIDEFFDGSKEDFDNIINYMEENDIPYTNFKWKCYGCNGHIKEPNDGKEYSVVETYINNYKYNIVKYSLPKALINFNYLNGNLTFKTIHFLWPDKYVDKCNMVEDKFHPRLNHAITYSFEEYLVKKIINKEDILIYKNSKAKCYRTIKLFLKVNGKDFIKDNKDEIDEVCKKYGLKYDDLLTLSIGSCS